MKKGFLHTTWIATLAILMFASVNVSSQDLKPVESNELLQSIPGKNPHSFIGTWIVQAQITNCAGTTLENFSKLVSINAGGTMQDVSSSSLFRSTGLGVWDHVDHRNFAYATQFFRFNPEGTPAGSVRAKWTVLMAEEGDSYTATGAIQIVSTNGTVVGNRCGVETGTRMVIPE